MFRALITTWVGNSGCRIEVGPQDAHGRTEIRLYDGSNGRGNRLNLEPEELEKLHESLGEIIAHRKDR